LAQEGLGVGAQAQTDGQGIDGIRPEAIAFGEHPGAGRTLQGRVVGEGRRGYGQPLSGECHDHEDEDDAQEHPAREAVGSNELLIGGIKSWAVYGKPTLIAVPSAVWDDNQSSRYHRSGFRANILIH